MTMNPSMQTISLQEFRTLPFQWSWHTVLRAAALGELGLLLLTMVVLHDLLAAALAVILLVGFSLFLLRGKMLGFLFHPPERVRVVRISQERVGALILGLLFADISAYTVSSTLTNLWNGAYGSATLLPASLAMFAVIGLVAAGVCVLAPVASELPNQAAVNFVVSVLLGWSIIMGIGLLGGTRAAQPLPPSDIRIVTENMAYSNTSLHAQAGHVIVEMENHDLFWHTFTIEALGVDMKVPIQGREQIAFDAPPGVYTFHCSIPGHELLGMKGTLTIR